MLLPQEVQKYPDFDLVIWQNCAVRDNGGRKLDHKTLEALRIRAVGQVEEGAHPEDVAAALGHCTAGRSVTGWRSTARAAGTRCAPGRYPDGRRSWAARSWPGSMR